MRIKILRAGPAAEQPGRATGRNAVAAPRTRLQAPSAPPVRPPGVTPPPPATLAAPPVYLFYFISAWKDSMERYFAEACGGKAELDFAR